MVMLESMFSSSLLCLNFQSYHTDFNYEEKKNKKRKGHNSTNFNHTYISYCYKKTLIRVMNVIL